MIELALGLLIFGLYGTILVLHKRSEVQDQINVVQVNEQAEQVASQLTVLTYTNKAVDFSSIGAFLTTQSEARTAAPYYAGQSKLILRSEAQTLSKPIPMQRIESSMFTTDQNDKRSVH